MNKYFSEIDLFYSSLERQILNINSKYDNKIDWGGCGTFSYALSEVLDKNSIPHEIVYVPEESPPPGAHRCDIKFNHILIKIDDILIDSLGIKKEKTYQQTIKLNKFKLKDMLCDKKLWNNIFPHEKWTDLTSDILNISI